MAISTANPTPQLATDFQHWLVRKLKGFVGSPLLHLQLIDRQLRYERHNSPKVVGVSGTWDKMHQIEPSHDQTLTKSTLFPKVPAELPIKIWSFAHPGPRILRLEYEKTASHTVCRQTPPEIWHTCTLAEDRGLNT